jgi:hypothetical protein
MASLMCDITAFNTVWTYELHQRWYKPDATDAYLMKLGQLNLQTSQLTRRNMRCDLR